MITIAGKKIRKVQIVTLDEFEAIASQGANPGEAVIISDTKDGQSFTWAFSYEPDLDPQIPWYAVGEPGYVLLTENARSVQHGAVGSLSWNEELNWDVPRPGVWRCRTSADYNDASATGSTGVNVYVGSSVNGAAPPAYTGPQLMGSNEHYWYYDTVERNLTLTAGQRVSQMRGGYSPSGIIFSMQYTGGHLAVRPYKIA